MLTQSEINKKAWTIAKELSGGSKGSKKFLSIAFKQVWKEIKESKELKSEENDIPQYLLNLLSVVGEIEGSADFCSRMNAQIRADFYRGALYLDKKGKVKRKGWGFFSALKRGEYKEILLPNGRIINANSERDFDRSSEISLSNIAYKHPNSPEAFTELSLSTGVFLEPRYDDDESSIL